MVVINEQFLNYAEALGLELNHVPHIETQDLIPWFKQNYQFKELINDFWGTHADVQLVAVTEDINDKYWKGLVAEWDSYTDTQGQFRISKNLVKGLLEQGLGEREQEFKLQEITELELRVFENFFVEMENYWRDFWRVSSPEASGNYTYLICLVDFALDEQEPGAFAIAVPPNLSPKNYQKSNIQIDIREIAKEFNLKVAIDLTVGKTKLPVSDIRDIESGDLILFENSNTRSFVWEKDRLNQIPIYLSLPGKEANKEIFIEDLEAGEMMQEQTNETNDLLRDLPVELTAQFKSVNMPLQKLMELEAGGVLPLGLLLDSKLVLMAPGDKAIAQGQLVVLGNQFGLQIEGVNFKAAPGSYPKAELRGDTAVDPSILANVAAAQNHIVDNPHPNPQVERARQSLQDLPSADDLAQELQDVGIDPAELDDLEDLY